jgi:hypothetical protein
MWIEFMRNPLFKGRIISRATEGFKENQNNWVALINQLGYMDAAKYIDVSDSEPFSGSVNEKLTDNTS